MYIADDSTRQLKWKEIEQKKDDSYIKFNSKLNLIEGYDEADQKTGTLYNEFMDDGAFFTIPLGESQLSFDTSEGTPMVTNIEYNYYYI